MEEKQSRVEQLLQKAAQAKESHHALHFSQAALNAAHALQVVKQIEITHGGKAEGR